MNVEPLHSIFYVSVRFHMHKSSFPLEMGELLINIYLLPLVGDAAAVFPKLLMRKAFVSTPRVIMAQF